MARNTRNFPKSDEDDLKDTIRKLKQQLRKLRKENRELKTENKTLTEAWLLTEVYLAEVTDDYSLEDIINHRKQQKSLTKQNKSAKVSKEETTEEFRLWLKNGRKKIYEEMD